MATWSEFEAAAPELAAGAKELFQANKHLTIATLRRDGSPLDLQRDPRFAVHSGTGDSSQWEGNAAAWQGDAKLSGRVEELFEGERRAAAFRAAGSPDTGESHLFRAEIEEVATVRLGGDPPDHLLIDSWREGGVPKQIRR